MLTLTNVSVRYEGGVQALHPLTLSIESGKFTVLLGRSGAGKSTLLRLVNLLVSPTTGSVCSPVADALNSRPKILSHRKRTGMVFQQHQLIGRKSALENVLLGRVSRYGTLRSVLPFPRADRLAALECLDRVGLKAKALQRADRLSGGEMQRVGVARALVMEPAILLADEPVASLDPANARQLLTLMRDICRKDGITLVMSLHQLDYAREFADRVIGLDRGRVVCDTAGVLLGKDNLEAIYGRDAQAAKAIQDAESLSRNTEPAQPASTAVAG